MSEKEEKLEICLKKSNEHLLLLKQWAIKEKTMGCPSFIFYFFY